jgi:hypothetical protein
MPETSCSAQEGTISIQPLCRYTKFKKHPLLSLWVSFAIRPQSPSNLITKINIIKSSGYPHLATNLVPTWSFPSPKSGPGQLTSPSPTASLGVAYDSGSGGLFILRLVSDRSVQYQTWWLSPPMALASLAAFENLGAGEARHTHRDWIRLMIE